MLLLRRIAEFTSPNLAARLYRRWAKSRYDDGNYKGAIDALNHYLRLRNRDSLFYLLRADLFMRQENYEGAIADITQALQIEINWVDLRYLKAGIAQPQIQDWDKVIVTFAEAPQILTDYVANTYGLRGYLYERMGNTDAAIEDYRQAVQFHPTNEDGYYLTLSQINSDRADYLRAIADATEAIRINPQNIYAYHNRALAFMRQGDKENALKDYQQGLDLDPQNAKLYNSRGYANSVMGRLEEALADCNQAIELDSTSELHFGSRGHTYFLMGKFEEALADFKKSAKLKPNHKFAISGQAISHHALGQVEKAKQLWQHLATLDSKYQNPEALKTEYHCAEPFVEEARKLIAKL